MKTCYQTRYDDGVFVGLGWADADPLEPGRFVLPGGCVDTAPPAFAAGQQARFTDGGWIIEPSGVPVAPPGVTVAWDGREFCIAVIPIPDLTAAQQASWTGAQWQIQPIPLPETPPAPAMTDAERLEAVTGFTPAALNKLLAGAV